MLGREVEHGVYGAPSGPYRDGAWVFGCLCGMRWRAYGCMCRAGRSGCGFDLAEEALAGHLAEVGIEYVSPRRVAEARRVADQRVFAGVVLAGLMVQAGVQADPRLWAVRDGLLGSDPPGACRASIDSGFIGVL